MGKLNDLKIKKVWFDDENIYIRTNTGEQKSHPLRWFNQLWNATSEQREKYEIGSSQDSIHWPELDEDLSLEGFYTYNKDEIQKNENDISKVFSQIPEINITRFAEMAKINRSLMASYICNEKRPGVKNKKLIEQALHQLGEKLLSIKLE